MSQQSDAVPKKAPPAVPKKAPPPTPLALQRQIALAARRAAEVVTPDDSASMVGSCTGSAASWTKVNMPSGPVITEVNEESLPGIDEHHPAAAGSSTNEQEGDDPWAAPVDDVPAPPPVANPSVNPFPPASRAAAPATQAARNLLEGVNETSAGRRLRRQ